VVAPAPSVTGAAVRESEGRDEYRHVVAHPPPPPSTTHTKFTPNLLVIPFILDTVSQNPIHAYKL
jgi:hypothetical protein